MLNYLICLKIPAAVFAEKISNFLVVGKVKLKKVLEYSATLSLA